MLSYRNRTKYDIVEDILNELDQPRALGIVQRSVNLRWDFLKIIISKLEKNNLVQKEIFQDRIVFRRTSKGTVFLENYKNLKKMVNLSPQREEEN